MDGASGGVGTWMEERTIGTGNPDDDFMTLFCAFSSSNSLVFD